jgi:hypothetical protein
MEPTKTKKRAHLLGKVRDNSLSPTRRVKRGACKVSAFLCLCCCLSGCGTVAVGTHAHVFRTRVTFYHAREDRFGAHTASGVRATEGRTVAAGRWLPFGKQVIIPQLRGIVGTGQFVVEDRGRDVERKKASHGILPVVDVFVSSRAKYLYCRNYCAPVMEVLLP